MTLDWAIRYPGTDLSFGSAASGLPLAAAPEFGSPDLANDDRTYPYGDGLVFGVDHRAGTTITFDLHAIGDEAVARARAAEFARAWRADAVRGQVGATAALVSPSGRTTFGRPRRFSLDENRARTNGRYRMLVDFATTDDLWYSDELSATATLGYRAAGGITFPAKFPLTTSRESDRSQVFTVGGDVDTWGVYEIAGPVSSPWFEIPGLLRYSFTGLRLAYDQWLTIDTRPWAREVYRNDGAPLGGALDTSSTLLAGAPIPPGQHEFLLRGTTTGTPRATVRWRDAHTTP